MTAGKGLGCWKNPAYCHGCRVDQGSPAQPSKAQRRILDHIPICQPLHTDWDLQRGALGSASGWCALQFVQRSQHALLACAGGLQCYLLALRACRSLSSLSYTNFKEWKWEEERAGRAQRAASMGGAC